VKHQSWVDVFTALAWHAQEFPGAEIRFGDVQSLESLRSVAFKDKVDVVVSCLASRTGTQVLTDPVPPSCQQSLCFCGKQP
jgi:hypothetical protein